MKDCRRRFVLFCIGVLALDTTTVLSVTDAYVGSSLTYTPSADATTGKDGLYAVLSAGIAWTPSTEWVHRLSYDFGMDTVGGGLTTYSTVSVGSLYRLSKTIHPKFVFRNTFSNNFDFYSAKLKPALRILVSEDHKVDPGLVFYLDTDGVISAGVFVELDFRVSGEWSVQLAGEISRALKGVQATQYLASGGVTYEVSESLSLYGSLNYSLGISSSPVVRGLSVGRRIAVDRPKPGKPVISDFSGATTPKVSLMAGILYFF